MWSGGVRSGPVGLSQTSPIPRSPDGDNKETNRELKSRQLEQMEIENRHTWDLGGVVGGYWIPIMTICRSEGTGLLFQPASAKYKSQIDIRSPCFEE